MDIEVLKKVKKNADLHKETVWGLVSDCMKYTSPNETVTMDNNTISSNDQTKGLYDSTAIIESSKLSKKLSNMIFPAQVQYGGLKTEENYSSSEKQLVKEYGDMTYETIKRSNLSKEMLNYLQNWSTIGTGALRIIETGDLSMPFRFKQLPLTNLSFTEDGFGRPNYVFFTNTNVSFQQAKQTWGISIESINDGTSTADVVESVYFEQTIGMEGVFHYTISDGGMSEIYKSEELEYNPFIVTRYKRFTNGIYWGNGEAMNCLSNIHNINLTAKLIRRLAKKSIDPALLGYGKPEIINRIKLKMGKITNMGDSTNNGLTLPPQGNPQIEYYNLQRDELVIKQTFYADFMNSVSSESGVRTAYEWKLRNQEFLNVFSPNYAMFEEEGLAPIFNAVFKILLKVQFKGMDQSKIEKLDIKPFFRNKLTDNGNFEKIDNFNRYYGNLVQNFGVPVALMMIDVAEAGEIISMWYEIDVKLLREREIYEPLLEKYLQNLIGSNMQQEGASDGGEEVV